MPASDDDPPVEHGPARAEEAIRQPTARQRKKVDRGVVETRDSSSLLRAQAQPGLGALDDLRRHEEKEHRLHTVEAEALPQLGEEEGGEGLGMPEESTG